MHWRTLLFIAALGAAASAPQQARAQAAPFVNWDETKLSPPAYKVRTEHNVRIPMRDGVTLSADIYRPDSGERFPALLLRTPYSNNAPDEIQNSAWFAAAGLCRRQRRTCAGATIPTASSIRSGTRPTTV